MIGKDVVFDCDELVIGKRVRIMGNAQFVGRRIELGDDLFVSDMGLRVGRGRRTFPNAFFKCGKRCTLHDNAIDLAMPVTLGDDVGLSPHVTLYCHYYWGSPFDGYPAKMDGISIGDGAIIGFGSIVLPGVAIGKNAVVGAGSVVTRSLEGGYIYGGNPARRLRKVEVPSMASQMTMFNKMVCAYQAHLTHRGIAEDVYGSFPKIEFAGAEVDVVKRTITGEENERTDDLRDWLFRNGVRIFTKRHLRRL